VASRKKPRELPAEERPVREQEVREEHHGERQRDGRERLERDPREDAWRRELDRPGRVGCGRPRAACCIRSADRWSSVNGIAMRRTFVSSVCIVSGTDAIHCIAGAKRSAAAPAPTPRAPKTTSAAATRSGTRFLCNPRTGALRMSVRSTAITTGSTTAWPSRSAAMTISVTMAIDIAEGDRVAFSGAASVSSRCSPPPCDPTRPPVATRRSRASSGRARSSPPPAPRM
jgi:hypothetical protein